MKLRPDAELDDRYTLIAPLGEGGQGSVWKAFDKNTGAERALKVVRLPEGDREAAERARREAHLVKDARHPAVVTCHSLFEIPASDLLVLVFDFVQATPLSAALHDPRFDRAHRHAALRQVAGALAFLHERGVVHRDLKPDNVLVTPVFWDDPAAPGSLKLIDFGIATPRRGADGATLSGMFGTPPYMAPELFGVSDVEVQRSSARDVFAFGVMGWEMFTGEHPTGLGRGAGAGAYAASYQAFRAGREPWPPRALEGRWGSVLTACLALEPRERPRDGGAIRDLLEVAPATPPPGVVEAGPRASGASPPARTEAHAAPTAGPRGANGGRPREVTEEHVVPEGSSTGGPSDARRSWSRTLEATESAMVGSLPRSSEVERTTPMPPEMSALSSPEDDGAHRGGDLSGPSPGAPKVAREKDARVGAKGSSPVHGGVSWVIVAAVSLFTATVAGTAWLLMDRAGSRASDSLSPPASARVPVAPASAVPFAEAPKITGSAADGAPAKREAPAVEVCCPRGTAVCSSGRPCSSNAGCKDGQVPERSFVLRVKQVDRRASIYEDWRNLADGNALSDSTVCVTGIAGERCATMRAIAVASGARLSRGADGKATEPLEVTTSEIRDRGLRLRIRNGGRWVHDAKIAASGGLKTTALCGTLRLLSDSRELSLVVHLDDSKPPPELP